MDEIFDSSALEHPDARRLLLTAERAWLESLVQEDPASRRQLLQEASELLRRSAAYEDSAETQLRLGQVLYELMEFEASTYREVLIHARAALGLDPNNTEAKFLAALCSYDAGLDDLFESTLAGWDWRSELDLHSWGPAKLKELAIASSLRRGGAVGTEAALELLMLYDYVIEDEDARVPEPKQLLEVMLQLDPGRTPRDFLDVFVSGLERRQESLWFSVKPWKGLVALGDGGEFR